MNIRILASAALIVSFAAPALADDFYIVRDTTTKKCTIVDKRPTTTTTITQVGPLAFKTRTEAEAGMKKEKICVEN
jgi:hypothetical protein